MHPIKLGAINMANLITLVVGVGKPRTKKQI